MRSFHYAVRRLPTSWGNHRSRDIWTLKYPIALRFKRRLSSSTANGLAKYQSNTIISTLHIEISQKQCDKTSYRLVNKIHGLLQSMWIHDVISPNGITSYPSHLECMGWCFCNGPIRSAWEYALEFHCLITISTRKVSFWLQFRITCEKRCIVIAPALPELLWLPTVWRCPYIEIAFSTLDCSIVPTCGAWCSATAAKRGPLKQSWAEIQHSRDDEPLGVLMQMRNVRVNGFFFFFFFGSTSRCVSRHSFVV